MNYVQNVNKGSNEAPPVYVRNYVSTNRLKTAPGKHFSLYNLWLSVCLTVSMARRYFSVFKKHIYLISLLVVLVIVSSIATGTLSTVTSVMAGAMMIIMGLAVTIWIVKTPAKRTKEEGLSN